MRHWISWQVSLRPPERNRGKNLWYSLLAGASIIAPSLTPALAGAPGVGVDPDAASILKRMTDYTGSLQRFELETSTSLEVVLHSGQKIQLLSSARLTVQRPDKLRADRIGDAVNQSFYYDGSRLTLVNPDDGYYASVPAPGTIDAAIDLARDSLDIVAPAGDLVTTDAYQRLMADSTSGFVVGKSFVDGVRCDHLAFRGYGVDWQIWIEDGEQPVPRKYVITTLTLDGAPQFEILISNWTTNPDVSPKRFEFAPSPDSTQIEFLPMSTAGVTP